MHERVLGLEVEYSTSHLPADGRASLSSADVSRLIHDAADRLSGSDRNTGQFKENGARLYYDDGHVEWATPECRGAREAVIYDRAGDRLMERTVPGVEAEMRRQNKPGMLWLGKNNVDAQGSTFGCHENYLVQRNSPLLASDTDFFQYLVTCLVPFLVSRTVVCGSGRVTGGQFHLSQRAGFLTHVTAENTRAARAIINTRDEPHADGGRFRRLHLILGDSNMAEWAVYLKLGTTALVLEMIEDLFLEDPYECVDAVAALKAISQDSTLAAHVPTKNKGRVTALEMQHWYLGAARVFFDPIPDDDTRVVLENWEETLRALEHDPQMLVGRLDWVTKQLWIEAETGGRPDWKDPIVEEMDWKYHGLHPDANVFQSFRQAGLVHDVVTADEVEVALRQPPPFTRARVRSEAVKRRLRVADWSTVRTEATATRLAQSTHDLADPLDWCPTPVVLALGLDQVELLSWITSGLESDSPLVRCQALQALAESSDRKAALLAAQGLADRDHRVRAAAATTLCRLKDGRVIEALQKAANDAHFGVRYHAVRALAAQISPSTG